MPLETGTQIGELNPANPPGTDPLSQADDHLRLIKTCVQGSLGEMEEIWGIPTNDLPLKGLNAAGDGYVEMIKVNDQDEVLVAGIKPQDKTQAYQKNKIINGGMRISQRGIVDLTNNVLAYGGADRFANIATGFTTFEGTARRGGNTTTGGGLENGGLSATGYVHLINVTAVTGTGDLVFEYRIEAEDAILLANREITFSGTTYANNGMATGAAINTLKPNSKDDWSAASVLSYQKTLATPTTTRVLESLTFTPTTADVENGFAIRVTFTGVTTTGDCQIGDWQLTESAEVLPWRSAGASVEEELAICQRYYEEGFSYILTSAAGAGEYVGVFNPFKADKRAVPSITTTAILSAFITPQPADKVTVKGFRRSGITTGLTPNAEQNDSWTAEAEL